MNPTRIAVYIGTSAVLGIIGISVALGLGNQDDSALTAYRSGRYAEAIGAFQQKIRSGQDIPHDHLHLFRALFEVGRYMEAEEVARGFIAKHPASSNLHNSLGEVLWKKGHLDEAEIAFKEASSGRADDWLTAELNLGIAAFERGRRTEAMQRFDRFIDFYNNGEATTSRDLTAVGIACQYLGISDSALYQDALKAFDAAVAADPNDLRPRILTGNLFLEKYDSGNAATELGAVLQINPDHPQALLSMARRMRFDGDENAVPMAENALKINPNLVGARVFLARELLSAERFDDAIEEITPALETNPVSLEALPILAAANYLRGDTIRFEEIRDRIFALNSDYADFYNTLAELLVGNRMYAEAVDFAHKATVIDPESWRAHGILGINQLRIGNVSGGRSSLEISFSGDPYNVWVKNTLDLLDTFPDYVESSTARFDLMVETSETDLLSLYLSELAEEAYEYFSERYRYEPPTPIRIELYPSHEDFSVRTVGLAGLGALGVSFGPVIALDSPSARPIGQFNWGSTLWHEIAHTFTLGVTQNRVPRWVSEGLAVYEEHRARPSWGDDVSISFLIAHLRGNLLPVSRITEGFVRPAYPEQILHSYFQASLVFELIDRDYGFQAILRLLDGYKHGLSTTESLEAIIGASPEVFDETFNTYLETLFERQLTALLQMLKENANSDSSTPRPPEYLRRMAEENAGGFHSQLSYGTFLLNDGRSDEAVPYLEAAKRLFPEYAEIDSPYWHLAMIAKENGDIHRATEELSDLTAINQNNYLANTELSALHEKLGNLAAAAEALDRAIYIYPFEIPTHQKLAGLYEKMENHPLAIRERKAVISLTPVDMAEALYLLARAEFDAGNQVAAKGSIIRSLEIAPGYPAAQELLLAIIGREKNP
ncbi:MAG: tetratricopeptide repeat protein [Acidobacteriota bacterium]|nr:tetratricopeptide repeat protein [Acidobacteriota bacterium]